MARGAIASAAATAATASAAAASAITAAVVAANCCTAVPRPGLPHGVQRGKGRADQHGGTKQADCQPRLA